MVSAVSSRTSRSQQTQTRETNTQHRTGLCKRVKVFVDQLDLHVLVHRHKQHLCARGKAPADAADAAQS